MDAIKGKKSFLCLKERSPISWNSLGLFVPPEYREFHSDSFFSIRPDLSFFFLYISENIPGMKYSTSKVELSSSLFAESLWLLLTLVSLHAYWTNRILIPGLCHSFLQSVGSWTSFPFEHSKIFTPDGFFFYWYKNENGLVRLYLMQAFFVKVCEDFEFGRRAWFVKAFGIALRSLSV